MADQLSWEQIEELRKHFDYFDKNGDGSVNAQELGKLLHSMGHHISESELHEIINDGDLDGDLEIGFGEFLTMMAPKIQETESLESLRAAFNVFDRIGDGFIRFADIRAIINSLGEVATDEEINEIIIELDHDGDGRISWTEFQTFMKSTTSSLN